MTLASSSSIRLLGDRWQDPMTRLRLILVVVVVLGIADLLLTIGLMSTTGMLESNPIVRALAMAGPVAVVAFKLAVIGLNAVILWSVRHRRCAEVGAWFSLGIMAGLSIQWLYYMQHHGSDEFLMHSANAVNWVRFGTPPTW